MRIYTSYALNYYYARVLQGGSRSLRLLEKFRLHHRPIGVNMHVPNYIQCVMATINLYIYPPGLFYWQGHEVQQ